MSHEPLSPFRLRQYGGTRFLRGPLVTRGDDENGGPEIPEIVDVPLEDTLDLHAFRPSEVAAAAEAYLEAAAAAGFREVRLIHGRGIGSQRDAVRRVCRRHPRVVAFADATPDRGGWGATVAQLDAAPREPPR